MFVQEQADVEERKIAKAAEREKLQMRLYEMEQLKLREAEDLKHQAAALKIQSARRGQEAFLHKFDNCHTFLQSRGDAPSAHRLGLARFPSSLASMLFSNIFPP